ncbi:MAG: 3-deoxy-D-manno-octulosonic acid transferase, partial [Helicobacter sp.]|nr:3-deoxy-D-manno-octulosonic acid transferase [Helicobacter sp.]
MSFFASLYYVCIALAHFCALPILFLLTFKSKYKISLKKRFFFPSFVKKKANLYWFHVCSFGEAKALYPVIESLQNLLKNGEEILITTTTQSGFKLARISYPRCLVYYLPFETFIPFWMHNLSLKCFVVFE